MWPSHPAGASPERKHEIAADHVLTEECILVTEVAEKLLRNKLLKCVGDDCLCALKGPLFDYENYTVQQSNEHLFENYGKLGLKERKAIMERFRTPPEWGKPIDRHFGPPA